MKINVFLKNGFLFLFFLSSSNSYAQNEALEYDRGTKLVYEKGEAIGIDRMFVLMRPYKDAFTYIEASRDYKFFSTIVGSVGGAVIGFPIGRFLVTNDFNWPLFTVGAGLIAISIPLHFAGLKQKRKAVEAYNGLINQSSNSRMKFSLAMNSIGIGIHLNLF